MLLGRRVVDAWPEILSGLSLTPAAAGRSAARSRPADKKISLSRRAVEPPVGTHTCLLLPRPFEAIKAVRLAANTYISARLAALQLQITVVGTPDHGLLPRPLRSETTVAAVHDRHRTL